MIPNPHDRLFRYVFSKPEEAAGELQAALPETVTCRIDWATLQPVPATFVDAKLAARYSDLIFSVRLDGRQAFIYLLLEHQSTTDAWMAFRLLAYMIRIWEKHLEDHAKVERLPAIVPLVVHHSAEGWKAPLVLSELIDLTDEARNFLADYIPNFRYELDEISAATNDQLLARRMPAFGTAALICLSRAQATEDLVSVLEELVDLLWDVLKAPNGVAALGTILRYLLEVTKEPERVEHLVQLLGRRGEEAYMTAAQMLTAEALARGREQGRAEGEAKVLLRQLEQKFGGLPKDVVERVRDASIEELDRWVERVITARSLHEVLAD